MVPSAIACTLLAPPDNELSSGDEDRRGDGAADASVDAQGDAGRPDAGPCADIACGPNAECHVDGGAPVCVCGETFRLRDGGADGGVCVPYQSCDQLHTARPELPSGPYALWPPYNLGEVQAYCEMRDEGGGWTLIFNQDTRFEPGATIAKPGLCYEETCTSAAYNSVRLRADVMLDVSDTPISKQSHTARIVITGIDSKARGKTVRQLIATGPYYLDDDANSNVKVRVATGLSCSGVLPWELANTLCNPCPEGTACGLAVLVFGDADSTCEGLENVRFAIGAARSSTTPWAQCAGWPQAANYQDYNYLPDHYRIWIR